MRRERWMIQPNWSPDDPAAPPADPTPTPSDPPPADPSLATGGDPPPGDPPQDPPKGDDPPVAPEPLTAEALEIPEGGELDPELTSKFLEIMNDGEMGPKDRANALLKLQADAMKAASEQSSALWQETQQQWQDEVRNDPELGGEKLDENLAGIRKLLDEYGSKELEDLMDLTGVGNNIHMVRFVAKLAKAFGEGQPLSGRPTSTPQDPAAILYPQQGS